GFYKSSAVKNAQITHIGGSNPVNGERVSFNGVQIGNNVNPNPMASSSGRVLSSFSANVSSLMSRNVVSQMFGETATTSADHVKATPYDCDTWAAVVFRTDVADVDGDGIPDGVEDAPIGSPLHDPPTAAENDGPVLPDLHAMGAGSGHKDMFIEVQAMRTNASMSNPVTYGDASAPFSST